MPTTIEFAGLTPLQVSQIADILQKMEALNGELAKIQTARAQREALASGMENDINTELNKLRVALRSIRSATITTT